MGNNFCRPDSGMFSSKPQKFFKEIDNENIVNEAKERVKLNITIKKAVSNLNYKVSFSRAHNQNSAYHKEAETIELQAGDDSTIIFPNFFVMDYFFERQQLISFTVEINGVPNEIKTTLGNVMGSRQQTFVRDLSSGECLEVKGQGITDNDRQYAQFEVSATQKFYKNKICFLIKNCGTQSNPVNIPVYKSEGLKGNDLKFASISIANNYLISSKDFSDNMICIEIYDIKTKEKIGTYTNSFASFIGRKIMIDQLTGGGQVTVNCKIITKYSFIDYLKGGIQIALTIGIDFTGSNGNPTNNMSYHYTGSSNLNSYEKAIKSCGDIVAYYDYDQLFPVYGYGAVPENGSQVEHCFPLNGKDDPNIHTIDEILKVYRKKVTKLRFSGPTNFAPLIRELNNAVIEEKQKNNLVYNILMILTDGQISDMQNTIDELVRASFEPISVIIIGIGGGPFGNMDVLDADDAPLYDRNKRKAARDLVQFVPFNKFKNDGIKLAEQVLEEVPRQVCEYYEMIKMIPGDPILDK